MKNSKGPCFFNELLHKQKDGVAMDSLLGPTLANTFFCLYGEKKSLQCFGELKLVDLEAMWIIVSYLFKFQNAGMTFSFE